MRKTNVTGKVFSIILTDQSMMVTGMKMFVMVTEHIPIRTMMHMKANGKIIKDMAKELILMLLQV